jgi:hypothetical protein
MSVAQKVAFPLLGGVVCPTLGLIVYFIAKYRHDNKATIASRSTEFNSILSGVLLGQVLMHTMIPGSELSTRFLWTFVVAGFVLAQLALYLASRFWWNTHVYYTPTPHAIDEHATLDKRAVEERKVAMFSDVGSDEAASAVFGQADDRMDRYQRIAFMIVLQTAFVFIVITDGFLAAASTSVAAYYVNGVSIILTVYGSMLKAKLHAESNTRVRRAVWIFLVLAWSIVFVCSSIPTLIQVNLTPVVLSMPYMSVYGTVSGVVLALWQYYFQRPNETDRPAISLLVFTLALAQSIVTAYFLN